MGAFTDAFQKIGTRISAGLTDAASLDVVTFTGTVEATIDETSLPQTFEEVLKAASASTTAKVRLLASTQSKLDGDILTYYDTAITPEEASAHNELVELAQQNRQAIIEFVHQVVGLTDIEPGTD